MVAVGEGAFRIGVDFDDEAVRTGCNGGKRERGDERGVAAGVARIDNDRQMRFALEHGDRGDVERVARGGLVGADTALN